MSGLKSSQVNNFSHDLAGMFARSARNSDRSACKLQRVTLVTHCAIHFSPAAAQRRRETNVIACFRINYVFSTEHFATLATEDELPEAKFDHKACANNNLRTRLCHLHISIALCFSIEKLLSRSL